MATHQVDAIVVAAADTEGGHHFWAVPSPMAGELGVLTQPDKPSWYEGTQPGWHVGTGCVAVSPSLLRGEMVSNDPKFRVSTALINEKLRVTSHGRLLELLRLMA